MLLNCASYNALADAYLHYGDYRHVAPDLLIPEARIPHHLRLVTNLRADVIGLQEVEQPLVAALRAAGKWQQFWSPKEGGKPDGCLMLVRRGIPVVDFTTHAYSDDSNHIMQSVIIGGVVFANTHIKWAPAGQRNHSGIAQTEELLEQLSTKRRAVIFADCNDRPNGPVRRLVEQAGFINTCGNEPTALIGQERAALDLIAVRGVRATRIKTAFRPEDIPNIECPSDHIPVMASIEVD